MKVSLLRVMILLAAAPLVPPSAHARMAYVDAKGTVVVQDDSGKLLPQASDLSDPAISPDGKFLAATANVGDKREVRVLEIDTGNSVTLPIESEQVFGPLWSPDGKWIALNVFSGSNWDAALIRPDGTEFRKLIPAHPQDQGAYVAGWNVTTGEPLVQNLDLLWQAHIDGTPASESSVEGLLGSPCISSASRLWIRGRTLYVNRMVDDDEIPGLDGPSDYIVAVDLDNPGVRRITPVGMNASEPFLTAKGDTILFSGFQKADVKPGPDDAVDLTFHVMSLDLKTGEVKTVVPGGRMPSISD